MQDFHVCLVVDRIRTRFVSVMLELESRLSLFLSFVVSKSNSGRPLIDELASLRLRLDDRGCRQERH